MSTEDRNDDDEWFFYENLLIASAPTAHRKKNDDDMSWSGTCDVRTESVGEKEEKKKILRKQIFGLKYMNELSIC